MKTITILSLQCCVRCRRFGLTAVPLLVWFILLFGSSAYANDITWLANPVDNNWFNPANWSPPSVPGFLRPRALRSLDYHRRRAYPKWRRWRYCFRSRRRAFTIQSSLTFNSDSTYTYTFKARRNQSKTDKVLANGVTINSGATIALSGQTRGALRQGLVLTLISNTSANPIVGTFSNLPDGGIVTINGNNFQASYSGGDGNDLTLTVVP